MCVCVNIYIYVLVFFKHTHAYISMFTVQRQFGVDGRGGYSKQMERTMERAVARGLMAPAEFHCKRAEMMESLASGVDDGRTRTRGMSVPICNTAVINKFLYSVLHCDLKLI